MNSVGLSAAGVRLEYKLNNIKSEIVVSACKSGNIKMLEEVMSIPGYNFNEKPADPIFQTARKLGKTGDPRYRDILERLKHFKIYDVALHERAMVYGLIASGNINMLKEYMKSFNDAHLLQFGTIGCACQSGNMKMLLFIIGTLPRLPNEEYFCSVVMINACIGRNVEIVKYIIDRIGDLTRISYMIRDSISSIVCKNGDTEIAKLLDSYGLLEYNLTMRYAAEFGTMDIAMYVLPKCTFKLVLKDSLRQILYWDEKALAQAILDRI